MINMFVLANVLITASVILDLLAVVRQIQKVRRCHHSSDVSTAFCSTKVLKDFILSIGLFIYQNWAGFISLIPGAIAYIILYLYVIHYKPSSWKPNKIEKAIRKIV